MEPLHLVATKSTPAVSFDENTRVLAITGQSYPENAFKFYEPIFEWIDSYLSRLPSDTELAIEFQMPYINTSSTKCLMMLLDKFDTAYMDGKRVGVRWYCSPDNESEFECAEELKEDLRLPFDIIAKESDEP
ncbi:DUF1987 domain-containing protein [Paenibacillus oceani]|uniref:DUF1987 domain-containing protein n=1 Tax=Paenibacillus oceani TaxID=2772510 RepID=A0A927CFR0_9BACL|nr:DUF1987 domain-containing protein [Paenibacillus oceani]MBD2866730.1 DUF1987 domain-containing protein [Paenibacillus oceani]